MFRERCFVKGGRESGVGSSARFGGERGSFFPSEKEKEKKHARSPDFRAVARESAGARFRRWRPNRAEIWRVTGTHEGVARVVVVGGVHQPAPVNEEGMKGSGAVLHARRAGGLFAREIWQTE